MIDLFQFGDTGIADVGFFSNEDIDEGVISRFQDDGIVGRIQTSGDSVVSIDDRKGNVGQAAGNSCSVQFQKLEVMRVFGDIGNGSSNIVDIFDLDQAGMSQN